VIEKCGVNLFQTDYFLLLINLIGILIG